MCHQHRLSLARSTIILNVMKLNSKYFDSIRVAPRREREEKDSSKKHPRCQWKGCNKPGSHRAPMGRGRDGEYFSFCIEHVREYNAAYNYFSGMSDDQVAEFQKDALTGHRPTWKVGANSWSHGTRDGMNTSHTESASGANMHDPHGLFAERAKRAREEAPERRRQLKPLERKSLETLHLSETASKEEIKSRFKQLVKRHHPDANGGDTRSEDTLREIIQAYNYLKQAGLV